MGRAINPAGIVGQVQGGVVQGLGLALYESLRLENGRYQERTLETYRLPLAVDVPRVEVILMEHADPAGPFGAKGGGGTADRPGTCSYRQCCQRCHRQTFQ